MLKGYIHPNFGQVARTFSEQLPVDRPGGAALCVYYRGEPVVDIWGGTINKEMEPWQADTLSLSFSTTKGIASTLLHKCVDQGLINYDDPVAKVWPEFGANGKRGITLRHIMSHEAGLYHFKHMVDHAERILDWEYMVEQLAKAAPRHKPGKTNGYHAFTYGWLAGEIARRAMDGKSFAELVKTEIADPLELDGLFVGLPKDQMHRRAHLVTNNGRPGKKPKSKLLAKGAMAAAVVGMRMVNFDFNETINAFHTRGMIDMDFNDESVVAASIPAVNGMFSAQSLAKLYSVMASGGDYKGKTFISRDTLAQVSQVQNRNLGRVIPMPMHWRLGFHRVFAFGQSVPQGFGHFGFGGSGAWCDPSRELSVGYVLNSGVGTPFGDARIVRINTVVLKTVEDLRRKEMAQGRPNLSVSLSRSQSPLAASSVMYNRSSGNPTNINQLH